MPNPMRAVRVLRTLGNVDAFEEEGKDQNYPCQEEGSSACDLAVRHQDERQEQEPKYEARVFDTTEGEAEMVAERRKREACYNDEGRHRQGCPCRHVQPAREDGPGCENIEQNNGHNIVDQR